MTGGRLDAMSAGPLSPSDLRNASSIVLARLESVRPAPWTGSPRPLRISTIELTFATESTVKGESTSQFAMVVRQAEQGPRAFVAPCDAQLWADKQLETSARFILFSCDQLRSCFRVESPVLAPEIRLLTAAILEEWSVPRFIERFDATPTFLTAQWILDQLSIASFSNYGDLNGVLTWLEQPSVNPPFRRRLFDELVNRSIQNEPILPKISARLLISAFRIAACTGEDPFKQHLIETLLPSLQASNTGLTAASVFADFPEDLPIARSVAAENTLLGEWLRQ